MRQWFRLASTSSKSWKSRGTSKLLAFHNVSTQAFPAQFQQTRFICTNRFKDSDMSLLDSKLKEKDFNFCLLMSAELTKCEPFMDKRQTYSTMLEVAFRFLSCKLDSGCDALFLDSQLYEISLYSGMERVLWPSVDKMPDSPREIKQGTYSSVHVRTSCNNKLIVLPQFKKDTDPVLWESLTTELVSARC